MNKFFVNILLISFMLIAPAVLAETAGTQSSAELKASANSINIDIVVKNDAVKAKYASAENRFQQGNVRISHEDFADLISKTNHDDYVFLSYCITMSEFGFFDLSDELISKLDNNIYTKNYISEIKTFYYPTAKLDKNDIIYFSDAYASIVYNNLAMETTSELINNTNLPDSDYKNYMIALGYYKSNDLVKALKYINNAISQNNVNVNYKILKAKILADSDKTSQAYKILALIKKSNFKTVDFKNKIDSAEEYVLYKTAKNEILKDYHLGCYYNLQNKSSLAIKVLQGAIMQAKEYAPQIYGLLGHIYYENNELEKAQEFAQKACKEDRKNYYAALTLGDISFNEKQYEKALSYYKSAKNKDKEITLSARKAKAYLNLNKNKKAEKIMNALMKKYSEDEDVLNTALIIFPQKEYEYLPTLISVDIKNNDVWLKLANTAINDKNYLMAETYLNNSYYIDENNFKYYYYLSQLYKIKGDTEKSDLAIIKSSGLAK